MHTYVASRNGNRAAGSRDMGSRSAAEAYVQGS
jgi:hypothetical protein